MSTDMEWTNELAIRLVELYREKPMLWNHTHHMYRVASAKYEAWNSIAQEFECDIADIRRKVDSLLASHRREKAKIRFGGQTRWFLYPYMSFLPNYLPAENNNEQIQHTLTENNTTLEKEESEESSADDMPYDNVIQEEIIIKEEPADVSIRNKRYKAMTGYSTHRPRLIRHVKKKITKDDRKPSKLDTRILEALKALRRVEQTKKKDECDSFGEYIADSLRRHDDRTQCMIKQAINNIMFEQEMKKYNTTSTVTLVVNGLDENPLKLSLDDDK